MDVKEEEFDWKESREKGRIWGKGKGRSKRDLREGTYTVEGRDGGGVYEGCMRGKEWM
jgi:hypothetical protein